MAADILPADTEINTHALATPANSRSISHAAKGSENPITIVVMQMVANPPRIARSGWTRTAIALNAPIR